MKTLVLMAFVAVPGLGQVAQVPAEWAKFDYAHQRVDSARIANLPLDQLRAMRGIVFGRHGRTFTDERDVLAYLKTQAWYHPTAKFTNASLTALERTNVDIIRRAEMTKHTQVETGDVRFLKDAPITVKMLGHHTAGDWEVLSSEIGATHGQRFESGEPDEDEEGNDVWPLQKYFENRYWYHGRKDYSPKELSAIEKANVDTILLATMKDMGYGVGKGMMYLFKDRPLTDSLLRGQTLYDLRVLRNEVYARHGRRFTTPWLRDYFRQSAWYEPRADFTIAELSQNEKDNIKLIQSVETKKHERLSTDTVFERELDGLFPEVARRLRNEIFARHGRTFKDPSLQSYFASQDWYHANAKYDDSMLTPIEKVNIRVIQHYEARAREGQRFTEG
jgi:hypothetical protein